MTRQPGGQGRKIDKHAGQPPTATSSRSLALSQPRSSDTSAKSITLSDGTVTKNARPAADLDALTGRGAWTAIGA